MFVLKSKYTREKSKYEQEKGWKAAYKAIYLDLKRDWNNLIEELNSKGGQEFLDKAVLFSDKEINTLIRLCHPDKHNQSTASNDITAKLLKIRQDRTL